MDRNEILLKEYEICQEDNNAQSTRYWSIFGIFVSVNVVVLGALAYGLLNGDFLKRLSNITISYEIIAYYSIANILIVAFAVLTVLLKFWLDRINYLISSNHKGIHEIELELKMYRSFKIHIIDKWQRIRRKLKIKNNSFICENDKNRIWKIVWDELSREYESEKFALLQSDKTTIENFVKYQPKRYSLPSRFIAYRIFWVIFVVWSIVFYYVLSSMLLPYIGIKVLLIFGSIIILGIFMYRFLITEPS